MAGQEQRTTMSIGIDLGTTNCSLASLPLTGDEDSSPEILLIPQLVNPGEVASLPQLPSFIYLPPPSELQPGAFDLPWAEVQLHACGTYAQTRSAEVPARVVASAKSWLCHAQVDRRASILPWQAPDDVAQLSPVETAVRYLDHLRQAWNSGHPDQPLEEQELVLTVPASFDAVARNLSEEAARQAGLGNNLTLLEEPQAAFYAWLADQQEAWRELVQVGDRVLVCDIGGGTTDFSLIAVEECEGALALRRVAVGDHILLGGDNMDLALAYQVKARLEAEGKLIDDAQLRALTHSCRQAKETLLGDHDRRSYTLAIAGRGRRLLGKTISFDLTREIVDQILLDGFAPEVASNSRPRTASAGLRAFGLPYAADAAITRHLAAFLARHGDGASAFPTAVLFNGGVTKAQPFVDRLVGILDSWLLAAGQPPVRVLPGAEADLAVARGAAYYGAVRHGRGVRIRGGTARSYYIGIERAQLAVPGIAPRVDAVCIAPFGMEEGNEAELPQDLALVVGEPVSFRCFASAHRHQDQVGEAVDPTDPTICELPRIETTLQGTEPGARPVRLQARVTAVGTLELAACERGDGPRHRLEFNIDVR